MIYVVKSGYLLLVVEDELFIDEFQGVELARIPFTDHVHPRETTHSDAFQQREILQTDAFTAWGGVHGLQEEVHPSKHVQGIGG
jgi:hypothetical protein